MPVPQLPWADAPPSRWFLAAGVLFVTAAAFHLVVSAVVMPQVYASGLRPEILMVLDVCWYNVAVMLFGSAVVVLVAMRRPVWRVPAAWVLAAWCVCSALLFVGFGLYWFGSITKVPSWAAFLALSAVLIVAIRRDPVRRAQ